MNTRTFASIFGIVFLAVGTAGFFPDLVQPLHEGHPAVTGNAGQLFGLFPVNELHNIVHVLFGIWGVAAARSLGGAILYGRGIAIIYGVLAIAGFIPNLQTLFGFVPLYGNDIWLHGALALVGAYFGWVHRSPVTA